MESQNPTGSFRKTPHGGPIILGGLTPSKKSATVFLGQKTCKLYQKT